MTDRNLDHTGVDEMTCRELVELVTDYLEGALPPTERARFSAHIDRCTGCRNYLNQMRRTLQVVGKLSVDDLSPDAEQDLLQAFRGWKRERQHEG